MMNLDLVQKEMSSTVEDLSKCQQFYMSCY